MKQRLTFERAYAGAVNVIINGNEVGMIGKRRDNKWYIYGDVTPIPCNVPFERLRDAKELIKLYIEGGYRPLSIRDEITNGEF